MMTLILNLFFFLATFLHDSLQLRIIKFDVPSAKANGSSAVLHCDYDLEHSELYSVKYYKDHVEFYRYLPTDNPPGQAYNLNGIYLDLRHSNASHVTLYKTDLNSGGLYVCEISNQGLATRKNEKLMKIYVLPQETLAIKGARDYYRVNEHVHFDCLSGGAWPRLQLNWFINDLPAPPEFLTEHEHLKENNGLIRTKVGLDFRATRDYFKNDVLRLRCAASLTLVYELKAIEYLIDGFKKAKATSKRYTNAQINSKDIPNVTGVRDKYNVNDTINLNCSSTATNAQLSWLVNGHKVNETNLVQYACDTNRIRVLGLRMVMEKHHFQTEEIELQCVASHIKTIADFQDQVIIKAFNSEFLLSHSGASPISLGHLVPILLLYMTLLN